MADGYLVEEPGERAAIATMRELRARGAALRAIAAEVEARHGVRVSHMTVKTVLAEAERSAA